MNTEHELFGELHEQEENGLFGNEHRRQYEAQQEALRLSAVSESFSEWNQIWKKFAMENYISASSDYQKGLMDLRNWLEENFEVPLKKNSH